MNAGSETFMRYIDVVNRALAAHRDDYPFRNLLERGEASFGGKRVGVAVYQNNPDVPHDYFTIALHDGAFDILDHGVRAPQIAWKVSEVHLDTVVADPDAYIEHPLKLDLGWLRNRPQGRS